MKSQKYFWLKLKNNFFKRHDIRIIEDMEHGKEYVLFYMKLLVESIDHNGNLRFDDEIPYDNSMLASVTRTDLDIVSGAMEILTKFNMVEIKDCKTIYMTGIEKMIGNRTHVADRVEKHRSDKGLLPRNKNVTQSKSKILELDKENTKPPAVKDVNKGLFGEIWKRYPNPVGRKAAERHFMASVKTVGEWESINKALDNYLRSKRVKNAFIMNGSTWFNNWEDWIVLPKGEQSCSKCDDKGEFVSATGYATKCDCPAGRRK